MSTLPTPHPGWTAPLPEAPPRCECCGYQRVTAMSLDIHREDQASEITYALVEEQLVPPAWERYAREHILDVLRGRVTR